MKLRQIVLCLLLSCSLFWGIAVPVSASVNYYTTEIGEYDITFYSDWTASIKLYKGSATEVVIPSEIQKTGATYKVVSISDGAFSGNSNIKSVVIPEGITHISGDLYMGEPWGMNKGAFEDCTSLEKVNLPSTITHINFDAFKNTKIVNSQKGAIYVDNWLVGYDDMSASSFKVKSGTIGIGEAAFVGMSNLKKISLPNSIKIINDYAFYNSSLSSITLPNGLDQIESCVFSKTNISSITIPEGITEIGYEAFA